MHARLVTRKACNAPWHHLKSDESIACARTQMLKKKKNFFKNKAAQVIGDDFLKSTNSQIRFVHFCMTQCRCGRPICPLLTRPHPDLAPRCPHLAPECRTWHQGIWTHTKVPRPGIKASEPGIKVSDSTPKCPDPPQIEGNVLSRTKREIYVRTILFTKQT